MALIDIIKKDRNMRKLFGKRELKIIEKQLLGINLTSSERTRLSRDIRKKFEAVNELAKFSDEFKLKKGSEIKKIVEETKEEILKSKYFPRIKKIILFGSSVENQRTFRSDIDIAVQFDEISRREATEFKTRIGYSEMLDIQVYNYLPEKIKKEIDSKGRTLYERKNK